PGSSRFYLALEDDLLRIFGGERITGIMEKLGMEDGEPIENRLISKAIENAQAKVEGHNFDIRKQLLEYDDVMNQQREVVYRHRREALNGKSLKPSIEEMIHDKAEEIAYGFSHEKTHPEEWDWKGLKKAVFKQFNFRLDKINDNIMDGLTREGLAQLIADSSLKVYNEKEASVGSEEFRHLERIVMLQTVDNLWKDHLLSMDHLKEGIGLRGYAQQNPLIVYKKEGFELFQEMVSRIKEETLGILYRIQISEPQHIADLQKPKEQQLVFSSGDEPVKKNPVKRAQKKVGRNAPCPCGSGKKYKKCCGI
ncbi:MAG TPA: preprotein translocase subunit SecA, partial [Desulfobacteraceae bacterium]|nr:preprotein translocase subunit SecA [Desulfobacteraceae bacterium]